MLKEKFLKQKYDVNFTDEDYEYFNSVRKNYLSDILEKTAKLDKQLFFLSEQTDISEYKDIIYDCNRTAHSIKGTGYSYGFKFISEVSFCIEEILDYVLNKFNIQSSNKESTFDSCILFNDLLAEVIKDYFLKNSEFNVSSEYKKKLVNLINQIENIFDNSNEINSEEIVIKKNILVCGNTNFIFSTLSKSFNTQSLFDFYFAPGFIEILYELTKKKFDYIFSEYNLGEFNALSVYLTLKQTEKYSNIPFYFIVSDISEKLINAQLPSDIILLKDKKLINKIVEIIKKK
ncbi:hypothetical protein KA977_14195 [Candidatus Dependentiae bacterium]|nr:hypothetical protein [Candidatus Dependentiae bacterium]